MATNQTNNKKSSSEGTEMTIVSALGDVCYTAFIDGISATLWRKMRNQIKFLTETLGLSRMQVVFISIMMENDERMSLSDYAKFLTCKRLNVMKYAREIGGLKDKGWAQDVNGGFIEYKLVDGVTEALCRNEAFVPEKIDGLDITAFLRKLNEYTARLNGPSRIDVSTFHRCFFKLVSCNMHLPLCKAVNELKSIREMSVFLICVADYARYADNMLEGITLDYLVDLYDNRWAFYEVSDALIDGSSPLFSNGLIEHKCINGLVSEDTYVITRKTKEELLAGFAA